MIIPSPGDLVDEAFGLHHSTNVSSFTDTPSAGRRVDNELRSRHTTPKIRRRHDGSSNKVAVSNGLDIVGVS